MLLESRVSPTLPLAMYIANGKTPLEVCTLESIQYSAEALHCAVPNIDTTNLNPREFLAMLATAPDEVWIEFALLT